MNDLKSLVYEHGLIAKKSLGQNFIFDENILRKIAGDGGGVCLEIGPGPGGLTRELCKVFDKVISVEIDTRMCEFLNETMQEYDNFELINLDFLKCDLDELYNDKIKQPFFVAANLPYYITTPIMMKLLDSKLPIKNMRFLMQKEVAKRITSKEGKKDYGVLTIMTQIRANPTIEFDLPPHVFSPQPSVMSSLLNLNMLDEMRIKSDIDDFRKLVRCGFGNRRKQFAKNISNDYAIAKSVVEEKFESINITKDIRAERLTIEQFDALCGIINEIKNN